MSLAATTINPILAARVKAVEFLNGLEVEDVEPAVAVINTLLTAAGASEIGRNYTAEVTVTVRKSFDDQVEVDETYLNDAIVEAIGNELDTISGDVEVEDVDTYVNLTAEVSAEIDLEVEFTEPEGEDLEAVAIDALENLSLDDDWEIDASTASVGDISVKFA